MLLIDQTRENKMRPDVNMRNVRVVRAWIGATSEILVNPAS